MSVERLLGILLDVALIVMLVLLSVWLAREVGAL